VFITHKETVEKLVHHQAQEADCKVADWIDKVEVFHYVCPRFGQRAVVTITLMAKMIPFNTWHSVKLQ